MSEELEDREDAPSSESPHHAVDGAIVHARSRLSLLKSQLANLSLEVLRSTEVEVKPRGLPNKGISHAIAEEPSSPGVDGGDLRTHERGQFRMRSGDESMELDSQWRESETGTLSDDHEQFRSIQEIHDGSSCSSRSWSVGPSIAFGGTASDQMLLRSLTRGGPGQRRYESASPSDLVEEVRISRARDEDAPTWVMNCLVPFACWPKEETMPMQLTGGRESRRKRNKTNQSVRVPILSQAVRNAIGKLWDDYCPETAQDICQLVSEFLSTEDDGTIDPESCWVSGRGVSVASDGLPFAFTIHTFSSTSKPCTFGHANILAEITSIDQQTSGAIQKSRTEADQRAYGLASAESYVIPDHMDSQDQLPWNALPPAGNPKMLRQSKSLPTRDPGYETHSTFSFQDKEARVESGSSETLSTADLTAFIRVDEESISRRSRQLPQSELTNTSGKGLSEPEDEPHPLTFSEQDLIWDMHYPDTNKEAAIASRKIQLNEEHEGKRTYIGDTDSEESIDEHRPAQLDDLFSTSQENDEHKAIVPYKENNEEEEDADDFRRPQFFDSDPWSDVATASSQNGYLTQSMEVNVGEEDTNKKWGRMRKLSSLVRRVRRIIVQKSGDRRSSAALPTIPSIQEQEDSELEEGYYTCETNSPTGAALSSSATPSPRRRSIPEKSKSPDRIVDISSTFRTIDRPRYTMNSASTVVKDRRMVVAPSRAISSRHFSSVQNVLWEEAKSFKLPVKDLGNGQYLATGQLSGVGNYKLTVKIGKKKVKDIPKTISVVDPTTLGSGIGEDGPFFQQPDLPAFPFSSTMLCPHPDYPPCHSVTYDTERLEYAQKHIHIGQVDILFVVDCTSSMESELRQLPAVVGKIEDLVKEAVLCKRLRMGVIAYRDHHPEDEDNFLLKKEGLTENIDRIKHFIAGLEADGGDDYPEAMEVAFAEAVEGVRWSLYSSRFVIWVGDAPPHGYQGFRHKEALDEEKRFKDAKARLKKAAYAVDVAMMNDASPSELSTHDRDLAEALEACDAIGKFHDKYPLGIPGRVRWEEAIERVSSVGARVIALGLRNAVTHQASSNCLRTIAHVSGGALLEVSTLDASVIGPLTVSIVEQSLDQQLIEEEVCDLILCFKGDFEQQSKEDRKRALAESMSQAAKQPHRLQVLPCAGHNHRSSGSSIPETTETTSGLLRPDSTSNGASSSSIGPLSISKGSFDLGSRDLNIIDAKSDGRALLLGMVAIHFDDRVLSQVLNNLRNKAERVSRCLITNFESPEQWLEFHTQHSSDGLYRREKHTVSGLTSPLSLRYVVAMHIILADRQ